MGMPRHQSEINNLLLKNMKPEIFDLVSQYLSRISLEQHHSIEISNEPIASVCFPEFGVISVVARTFNGNRLETGLIGPEGMTGTSLLYGVDRTPSDTFVQIPVRVASIPASNFCDAIAKSRELHEYLLRYAYAFLMQSANTAFCNSMFGIDQRLARWLLMSHDRVNREDIMLTHEFLAVMLGVRRAGVTTALRNFGKKGAIKIVRGTITISDRDLLLSIAGDAYGIAEKTYISVMDFHTPPII